MSQSSFIVGGILAAFFVFVVLKGRLPLYLSVLGWGTAPAAAGQTASGGGLISSGGQLLSAASSLTSTVGK